LVKISDNKTKEFVDYKKNNFVCAFILLIFIIIIILIPTINAEEYYADININVDKSGFVSIDGVTNHPDLIIQDSENYTFKAQSIWLLNITKNDSFSEFIYKLTFPETTSIISINSTGLIRIEEELGHLIVKGIGENEIFNINVEYQIQKSDERKTEMDNDITIIYLGIVFIIVISIIILYLKSKEKDVEIIKDDLNNYNLKGLNNRQKEIIRLLIDKKVPLTQTDIEKELNIPKAAVSRNVHSLELKGLIEIEKIGMSNLIRIKKP